MCCLVFSHKFPIFEDHLLNRWVHWVVGSHTINVFCSWGVVVMGWLVLERCCLLSRSSLESESAGSREDFNKRLGYPQRMKCALGTWRMKWHL